MYTRPWDHMNNKHHDAMIVRDEDGAHIPFDEGNRDYQEYMAWVDEGNEPALAEQPPSPPDPGLSYEEAIAQLEDLEERVVVLEQANETLTRAVDTMQAASLSKGV